MNDEEILNNEFYFSNLAIDCLKCGIAERFRNKFGVCRNCREFSLIQKARTDEKQMMGLIIKDANIHISHLIINQNCERCNYNIEAHINHFVDCFYKEISSQLAKQSEGGKDGNL